MTTVEQIVDAMIARVVAVLGPTTGVPATSNKYLLEVRRYLGEFDSRDPASFDGIRGRCPSVLVAFAGEKVIRRGANGRHDYVEGSYLAICCSDSHRSREDRDEIYRMIRDVRGTLAAHRLGLAEITKLHYDGISVVAQLPEIFAWAVKLSTRYVVDYARTDVTEELESITGNLTNARVNPAPTVVGVKFQETD